jgi:hypothetical protein
MKAYEQFRAEMKTMLATDESFSRKDRKGKAERVKIPKLDDRVIAKAPMYKLYKLCKRAQQLEKDRLKVIKRAQDAASALRRFGRVEKEIGQAQEHINKAQGIYHSSNVVRRESPQTNTNNAESVPESVPLLNREPPWVGLLGDASLNLDKAQRALQLNKGFLMGHKLLKKQKMEGLLEDVVYGRYNGEDGNWLRREMNNWWYPNKLEHERSKAAEQWLIRKANDLLAERLTATSGQRIKIIRALLKVGLNCQYAIKAISMQLGEPVSVFYVHLPT